MKKKVLFAIMLLCLALTACGKDEPLESLEVTEAETKSIFDVSEDFENFISESLATPGSALSVMDEEVRLTIETEQETAESNSNINSEKIQLENGQEEVTQSETTSTEQSLDIDNKKEGVKVEEMPQELKEAIEAQNNKEVKEGLDIISSYLETLENNN